MIDVIVSGHLCIDLLPGMQSVSKEKMTIPGALLEIAQLGMGTGGAVSNTGQVLHTLGVDVRLMASVGDDLLGHGIVDLLRSRDPSLSELIKTVRGQQSSYSIVLSPSNADRTFLHCTGQNESFGVADIDYDLVAQTRIFHVGYPPLLPRLYADDGAEMVEMYRLAKQAGAVTSMDTAVPDPNGPSGQVNWRGILTAALPYVDIFVPSIDEIMYGFRREDHDNWGTEIHAHLTTAYLRELADELLELGSAVVGFKMGEMGLYLRTGSADRLRRLDRLDLNIDEWANVELYHPAFAVEVVGTTGAGDAAYAGLLASMLRGLNPADSLQMAAAVGSSCVEALDSTSAVASWDDTQTRIQAGWATRPEILPE